MKDRAFITGGSCRARICMEGVEISRLSVQRPVRTRLPVSRAAKPAFSPSETCRLKGGEGLSVAIKGQDFLLGKDRTLRGSLVPCS